MSLIVGGVLLALPALASADNYATGYAGWATGGNTIATRSLVGASLTFGHTEIDLCYSPGLYDEDLLDTKGSALFANFNWLIRIPIKNQPVVPYVAFGGGLARSTTRVTVGGVEQKASSSDLDLDLGGGVIYNINKHVGIRGDLRFFRVFDIDGAFDDLEDGGGDLEDGGGDDTAFHIDHADLWRITVGASFRF